MRERGHLQVLRIEKDHIALLKFEFTLALLDVFFFGDRLMGRPHLLRH